jgi:hypothetical protein
MKPHPAAHSPFDATPRPYGEMAVPFDSPGFANLSLRIERSLSELVERWATTAVPSADRVLPMQRPDWHPRKAR